MTALAPTPTWLVPNAEATVPIAPEPRTLTVMVRQAADRLAAAQTSADVLDARDMASVAYDAAKSVARLAKAKGAHDELIAKAHRAQADALEIEAAAKRRLADEYDAARERGEVAGPGGERSGREHSTPPPTVAEIGLTRKEVHAARQIRDAEAADPGIIRRTLDTLVEGREEPTRAAVRRAIAKPKPPAGDPPHPIVRLLQAFERNGYLATDPHALRADMTEADRADVDRLATSVARLLIHLTPPAPFAADPADTSGPVQDRHGSFIAEWDEPPSVGLVIFLDEQRYDLIGIVPSRRRDGARTAILTWQSYCPTCGTRFWCTTGLRIPELTRRCPEHRSLRPLTSGGKQFGRRRLAVRIFPAVEQRP